MAHQTWVVLVAGVVLPVVRSTIRLAVPVFTTRSATPTGAPVAQLMPRNASSDLLGRPWRNAVKPKLIKVGEWVFGVAAV